VIFPSPIDSRLLVSLDQATSDSPLDRKLLVCRERGEGRELLRALALRTGGWIGWEATTLRDLAGELAFVRLSEQGLRVLDEVELAAVVDGALDSTLGRLGANSRFGALGDGVGFRKAAADTIRDLRLAGVDVSLLRRVGGGIERQPELVLLYEEYLSELRKRCAADPGLVFETALSAFDAEGKLLRARIFLVPGLRQRGLPGKLLRRFLSEGASILQADRVHGLECPRSLLSSPSRPSPMAGRLDLLLEPAPPTAPAIEDGTFLAWLHDPASLPRSTPSSPLELFRAASPLIELREVLRRVMAKRIPWDQVEIVAADPLTYGAGLDTLAGSLGIPVTFGVGLPLERSRVGRLLRTYLLWLEGGFQARAIWEALARSEIEPPKVAGERPTASGVAWAFRRLRIGWSQERYALAFASMPERIAWLAAEEDVERDDLDAEERAIRRRRRELELKSVQLLLGKLLQSIPPGIPQEGLRSDSRSVSPSAVARGALEFLTLFRPRPATEEQEALERVSERLERQAAVTTRSTTLSSAVADVRAQLQMRVPRAGTRGDLPWSSAAGALHLTDVTHAGRSGRPYTFVMGLDAERTTRGSAQDPLLPDSARQALTRALWEAGDPAPGLLTSEEVFEERRYELASMLTGLRGDVTLSYAAWEAATGSALVPSPLLLQAHRVKSRDPTRTFEDLDRELREPVSLVPASDEPALDETDVWMRVLRGRSQPQDGIGLVRASYPLLASGLRAEALKDGHKLSAFQGYLPEHDVFEVVLQKRPLSPSAVEQFGKCPLSWLYKYALRVRKTEDPEYDVGRWLTPLEKGSLLHRVFERFGNACRSRNLDLASEEAEVVLNGLAEQELERMRRLVPPSNAMAMEFDADEIRRSVGLFLAMERDPGGGRWEWFELEFGGADAPALVRLPSGRTLPVQGKVDRIDRLENGRLRVIDYKTGKIERFERTSRAPFDGGRKLQAGIYVPAVEAFLGEAVERFEYRFVTEKGQLRVSSFEAADVQAALGVVESLVEMAEAGRFLATNDADCDCKFCDYRAICRVERKEFDGVISPRADWSMQNAALPEYATMLRLRAKP
jgi:ATP-dependent helicase/nuclease subunit B